MTEPTHARYAGPPTPRVERLTGRQEAPEPPAPPRGPGAVATPAPRPEGVDTVGAYAEAHHRMRDLAALMAEVGDEERAERFRRFAYHAWAEGR